MHDDLAGTEHQPDPKRWFTLVILVGTVVLIAVDTSVLNVAIPTMLTDLDTTVPALEWVIAGYSLTFASLLIVGGRLGDLYGHRRLFVIGAALFGTGSFIASVATSVGVLIIGEAVVEGTGAALMMPSTLAILSATFRGRERATAFAAWGAAAGAAVAFGPVLGGYLTTNYSWRWSFRINVILAPLAVIGAMALMHRSPRADRRIPIDALGAALIASGTFFVVFALSQGPTYGWFAPIESLEVGGVHLWPDAMPVSAAVAAFVLGLLAIVAFIMVERHKERRGTHPLFEIAQLRHRTFRYGLITAFILSLGQLGVLFALPLFLQRARGLTAEQNGFWMLPIGLAIIAGAQIGGPLTRRIGVTSVCRLGLVSEAIGIVLLIVAVSPSVSFLRILPGLVVFGVGVGFLSSQLTNVILSEISLPKTGVASGANSSSRQVGAALGAAIIGSLITVLTTNQAVDALRASDLAPAARDQAIAGVQEMGASWTPSAGSAPSVTATANRILDQALSSGTRAALVFAAVVVFAGALLSLLIPQVPMLDPSVAEEIPPTVDGLEPLAVEHP